MLGPHERIYYLGSVHWIVMFSSILLCLVMAYIGFSMMSFINSGGLFVFPLDQTGDGIGAVAGEATNGVVYFFYRILRYMPWLIIAAGILWVIKDSIHYIFTRVLLTSRRMIIKRGLLMVRMHEIELDEIEASNVNQLMFGRLLGYGRIHLDARLVNDYDLPILNNPYKFVKILHILKDYDLSSIHAQSSSQNVDTTIDQQKMVKDNAQFLTEAIQDSGPIEEAKPHLRKTNNARPSIKKAPISQEDLDFLRENEHV